MFEYIVILRCNQYIFEYLASFEFGDGKLSGNSHKGEGFQEALADSSAGLICGISCKC